MSRIESHLSYRKEWHVNRPQSGEVRSALSQGYAYLGHGHHFYAFVSDDDAYVLKFFKHDKTRPSLLNPQKKAQSKQKSRDIVFQGCIDAFANMQEETALLHVHLNKGSHEKPILLKDKVGRSYTINLNEYTFVLQRKAEPFGVRLLRYKKEGRLDKAKADLASLLAFARARMEKGYNDRDVQNLMDNFGFINGRPIQIDVGEYFVAPDVREYYFSTELRRVKRKFLPWLSKNYPELKEFAAVSIESQ